MFPHDRYFLDQTVNNIFEIDNEELYIYQGNYSLFKEEREKRLLAEFHEYKNQQERIKKIKKQIKQLRIWANQGQNPKLYKKAKSLEKALSKIELVKKPTKERNMNLQLDNNKEKIPKDIVILDNVAKSYDFSLFEKANMLVNRNEKISIVGDNGAGKSTLLKMIVGKISPDKGNIYVAKQANIGYLSQHTFDNLEKGTVIDVFRNALSITEGEARYALAQFLFFGADVYKSISSLSGGEKMRLKWAQLMNQPIDLLILDEPTNHLDIESKEVLEEALNNFSGTVISVSHDRYFLDECFDITYWIENNSLVKYNGNYSYATEKRS